MKVPSLEYFCDEEGCWMSADMDLVTREFNENVCPGQLTDRRVRQVIDLLYGEHVGPTGHRWRRK